MIQPHPVRFGPTNAQLLWSVVPAVFVGFAGTLGQAIGLVKRSAPGAGYRPPKRWFRIVRSYSVAALDGSQLQVDPRGLVRLCAPNGEFMVFPIGYDDRGEDFDCCDVDASRPVEVWLDPVSFRWDGLTGAGDAARQVAEQERVEYVESILRGLHKMGFSAVSCRAPDAREKRQA